MDKNGPIIGDRIKITGVEAKWLRSLRDDEITAMVAFTAASKLLRKAGKDLWDGIFEIYPTLKFFKCKAHFPDDEKDIYIEVVSELKEEENNHNEDFIY